MTTGHYILRYAHIWRMLTAMWIATASFLLGQATLFPAAVRRSGVLTIPVLLVLASLLYWLVKCGWCRWSEKSSVFSRATALLGPVTAARREATDSGDGR